MGLGGTTPRNHMKKGIEEVYGVDFSQCCHLSGLASGPKTTDGFSDLTT